MRKLRTNAEAIEVRAFASLVPGQPLPIIQVLTIPTGEMVEFSAEEDEPGSVRVSWQGRVWVIDKAVWNSAESVTR